MNRRKLKEAERRFLDAYSGGFQHPDMVAIGKKHRMGQMVQMAKDRFSENRFRSAVTVTDDFVKIVGRSSMVSMFEKPRFRDSVTAMGDVEIRALSRGLKGLLHGEPR